MHPLKIVDFTTAAARNLRLTAWISFSMLSLAQHSATVLAQDGTDPMEVCYRMSDADLRHACFDREMQRRHAADANAPRAAPGGPAGTVGLDGRQLSLKRKEEGIQPEVVKPIVAVVAQLRSRPGHLYSFELDNGQIWQSTDTEADLFLGPRETVQIRPGILGAFFLRTAAGRSIRIHRVR